MLLQMTQGGIGIKDLSVIEESERERETDRETETTHLATGLASEA
jgi:hypothetical protein